MSTTNANWTQATWFIDPQNSSGLAHDNNTGLTSSTPLLTWGEMIARMGTTSPYLAQITTFTFMSGQSAGQDPVFFTPRLANGAQAILIGTLTSVGTIAINTATVTAQVRGGPGTRWQVSNMPGGAAAKMLLQDTTLNTWAFIDSISSGTATISQPLSNSLITTVGQPAVATATMATHDAFTVWSLPAVNLKVWRPTGGGDITSGGAPCTGWVQFIDVVDTSGSASGLYQLSCDGPVVNTMSACKIDPRVQMAMLSGRGHGAYLIGCDVTGGVTFIGSTPYVYAGVLRGGVIDEATVANIDGDCVVHGTAQLFGHSFWGAVYADGQVAIEQGATIVMGTALWGSASVFVSPGGTFWNNSSTTWVSSLLTSGALTLGASNTGSAFFGGSLIAGIAISAANLDTYSGLQDPTSGAKFTLTNGPNSGGVFPPPPPPPSWSTTDWYLDGVSGNDSNSGIDAGHPVQTIMGGIVGKWGTTSPRLSQTTTIHVLVGQATNLERAILTPILQGSNTNFVIVGTPSNTGGTFTAGTVTHRVRSNPGNDLLVASMPGGSAAGDLVFNSTRNSYAFIKSMSGSTATMEQPFTTASLTTVGLSPFGVADDTWTTGDTLQRSSVPALNLQSCLPTGGDANTGFTGGMCWIQMIRVPDVSGADGNSTFTSRPVGCGTALSLCRFDTSVLLDGRGTSLQSNQYALACHFSGGTGVPDGGCVFYECAVQGGACIAGSGVCIELANGAQLLGDVIIDGDLNMGGDMSFLASIGGVHLTSGAILSVFGEGATFNGPVWGAGTINLKSGNLVALTGTWTNNLLVASAAVNNITSGYATAGNGVTYGPFAITGANLDLYGGLRQLGNAASYGVVSAAPATPVTWTTTDWYIDPVGGNDNNPGTGGSPVKTVMGGVVPRWGTKSPILPQTTTLHIVSSETSGQERILISPQFTGSGTNLIIIGTPSNVGSTFVAGTVTAKVRAAPGNSLQIASMPGGAVAGQLVRNITRSSSAFIASMSGSTATMEQPLKDSLTTTVTAVPSLAQSNIDDTWTTGDTLQLQTVPTLNLVVFTVTGGDSNSTDTTGSAWVQWIHVPDISGAIADSDFTVEAIGPSLTFSQCSFDPFLLMDSTNTSFGIYMLGCHAFGGGFAKSIDTVNTFFVMGGALGLNGGFAFFSCDGGQFGGDVMVFHFRVSGFVTLQGVQILTQMNNGGPATISLVAPGVGPSVWGGIVQARPGGNVINATGNAWTSAMAVTIDFLSTSNSIVTTASSYVPTTGTWCAGIPLTMANLVTWGTLLDGSDGNAAGFIFGPGTPAFPPSWLQATWYIDPQNSSGNASDNNAGSSSGAPLLSWKGVIAKLGTESPHLGQATTFNMLSGQSANTDEIFFSPKLHDGGQAILLGTLTSVGTIAINTATVTTQVRGAPGTRWKVSNMPGGAAAKMLLQDTTANTWAFIDSITTGTATISQPVSNALLTTVGVPTVTTSTMATNDAFTVWSLPKVNLKQWHGVGADQTAGGQASVTWVGFVEIADASAANGTSVYNMTGAAKANVFSACRFDVGRVHIEAVGGINQMAYLLSCDFGNSPNTDSSQLLSGNAYLWAGINRGNMQSGAELNIGGDHVQHGALNVYSGFTSTLNFFTDTNAQFGISVYSGFIQMNGIIWGTPNVWVFPQASISLQNGIGTWANNLLTTGFIKFNSLTTGYAEAGNGLTYGPFLITPANLDTYNGLFDPESGARMCIFNGGSIPAVPLTWTQATWYFDPQNSSGLASDNNSGLDNTHPLSTWKGVISKLGTESPHLGQATTFNAMSAQSANTDEIFFSPKLHDGGQAILLGTLTQVVDIPTCGAVTAMVRGAPGNLLKVASLPGGAAAKQLVLNVTRSSYAFIDSIVSNTGAMSRPIPSSVITTITNIPALASDDTWTTGDHLTLYTLTSLNVKVWRPQGGDITSGGVASGSWIQFVKFADTSGANTSQFNFAYDSAMSVLSACQSEVKIGLAGNGRFTEYLVGCDIYTATVTSGLQQVYGGIYRDGLSFNGGSQGHVGGDAIFHFVSTSFFNVNGAFVNVDSLYSDGTVLLQDGTLRLNGPMWGSFQLQVNFASTLVTNGIVFTGNLMTSVPIQLGVDQSTIGYATTGDYTYGPFLLTAANLDTYHGLKHLTEACQIVLGSGPLLSGTPLTWTQATWYIDPANSSAAASDNNSGLTSGAPLLTFKGLISKWGGTTSPTLRQSTNVTFLSSHTDNTDPVILDVLLGNGANFTLQGTTPTTVSTGVVLSGTTAKSRTAGSNSLLITTLGSSGAAGQLVQNTTVGKTSRAWSYKSLGGNSFSMTQPLVLITPPTTAGSGPAEVDTWANTDTVNLLHPISINIAKVSASQLDPNGGFNNQLYVYQCTVLDPVSVGSSLLEIKTNVQFTECAIQRYLSLQGGGAYGRGFANCLILGGGLATTSGTTTNNDPFIVAGALVASTFGTNMNGVALFDGDVIIGDILTLGNGGAFGCCYLDAQVTVGGNSTVGSSDYNGFVGVVYGSGANTINLQGTSRMANLHGTFVPVLTAPGLITGVKLNGSATGHSVIPGSPDVFNGGIATTPANLDATAGASGFGGTAFNFGGASISNVA